MVLAHTLVWVSPTMFNKCFSLSLLTLGSVFQGLDWHLLLTLLLICTVSLYAVKPFILTGIFYNCSLSLLNKLSLLEANAICCIILGLFGVQCGLFSISGVYCPSIFVGYIMFQNYYRSI